LGWIILVHVLRFVRRRLRLRFNSGSFARGCALHGLRCCAHTTFAVARCTHYPSSRVRYFRVLPAAFCAYVLHAHARAAALRAFTTHLASGPYRSILRFATFAFAFWTCRCVCAFARTAFAVLPPVVPSSAFLRVDYAVYSAFVLAHFRQFFALRLRVRHSSFAILHFSNSDSRILRLRWFARLRFLPYVVYAGLRIFVCTHVCFTFTFAVHHAYGRLCILRFAFCTHLFGCGFLSYSLHFSRYLPFAFLRAFRRLAFLARIRVRSHTHFFICSCSLLLRLLRTLVLRLRYGAGCACIPVVYTLHLFCYALLDYRLYHYRFALLRPYTPLPPGLRYRFVLRFAYTWIMHSSLVCIPLPLSILVSLGCARCFRLPFILRRGLRAPVAAPKR